MRAARQAMDSYSLTHSLSHSLSLTHSLTHSLALSLSLTHSLTHSLTRTLTHTQVAGQMRAAGQAMDSYSLSALLAACRAGTEDEASAALRIFVAFQTNAKATVVCNAALDLCARQVRAAALAVPLTGV
jgi:hypothetical protein